MFVTRLFFFIILAGYVTCKSFHKREINRDTKADVIGPTVEPHRLHLYRHLAQLRYDCNHRCGSTIISARYLLTAAHCVVELDLREITITAGITSKYGANGEVRDVFAVIIHDGYKSAPLLNDIALLVLQEPLDVTKYAVAKLPKVDEDFEGSVVDLAGWGYTNDLTYGYFTVKHDPACSGLSQMCVTPFPNVASYKGDSGSSVVLRNGNDVTLVGIVSGRIHLGPDVNETLFVNVAKLRQWIDDSIAVADILFKIGRKHLSHLPKNQCADIDEAVRKVIDNL